MGIRRQRGEKSRLEGAMRSPYWLEYKICMIEGTRVNEVVLESITLLSKPNPYT